MWECLEESVSRRYEGFVCSLQFNRNKRFTIINNKSGTNVFGMCLSQAQHKTFIVFHNITWIFCQG